MRVHYLPTGAPAVHPDRGRSKHKPGTAAKTPQPRFAGIGAVALRFSAPGSRLAAALRRPEAIVRGKPLQGDLQHNFAGPHRPSQTPFGLLQSFEMTAYRDQDVGETWADRIQRAQEPFLGGELRIARLGFGPIAARARADGRCPGLRHTRTQLRIGEVRTQPFARLHLLPCQVGLAAAGFTARKPPERALGTVDRSEAMLGTEKSRPANLVLGSKRLSRRGHATQKRPPCVGQFKVRAFSRLDPQQSSCSKRFHNCARQDAPLVPRGRNDPIIACIRPSYPYALGRQPPKNVFQPCSRVPPCYPALSPAHVPPIRQDGDLNRDIFLSQAGRVNGA